MVKRWIRAFIVLIFFNILLAQVNEGLESEMRKKYSFTYFGADTEETGHDVQTEKYQQIDCNLLGDFLEGVDRKFIQSGVSQYFMKYSDWKKNFQPVVGENSSFPKKVTAALEEALYQCDGRKNDTVEFFNGVEEYESLAELGLYDLSVDLEEIDVLFPRIADLTRHSDMEEKYHYLREFYGIPENCRNIFHVEGDQDIYIFAYYSGDAYWPERQISVLMTERTGDEFIELCEFELAQEEMEKSDCGVIRYGGEIYYVYFRYNEEEHEFDGIKVHRMNEDPEKDTLEIKYLPENYVMDDTIYGAPEDFIDDVHYWDDFMAEKGTELLQGNYLKDGTGREPEIYYGDGEKPASGEVLGLGANVHMADIANCNLPVYIRKKYVSDCLEVSFYYYDSSRNLVRLSDLSVDEPPQCGVDLVQLWFQEIEGTIYTFRLYHASEYNYLLNVLLLRGGRATMIRTLAMSPTRRFVLEEGGTERYEEQPEPLEKVMEEDEYYKIADRGNFTYYCAIYNSQGEIVDEREATHQPIIEYIDDTVLRLQISMGTNALWTLYYDTLNDRFSKECFNPLTEGYGKMVVPDYKDGQTFLVVQDIFDKESFYKEIPVDCSPLVTEGYAEFMDESRLYVSYRSESGEKKAEVLELGR